MNFLIRHIFRVYKRIGPSLCLGTVLFLMSVPGMASQATEPSMQARLASKSLLLDLVSLGARIVAVGNRGHILLTDDGGRSWRQVEVPTRAMLTGVYFNGDKKHGWAVGHDAVLLGTEDGGDSWHLISSAPEEEKPLFDVMVNGSEGFAIGAYAKFMVTRDGGKSWAPGAFVTKTADENPGEALDEEESFPFDYHLNRVV
ncbi:MAG: hypothetical protein JRH15_14745, partial [Deltaproteobacteria bacterium]|nr:hypothetical protein [Deltaproteobacteria bacterium]